MDIIFAGSPSSSAEILSTLVDSPFNISLVLTQADKRSSRNKAKEPSEVAKFAESANLPCFKIDTFCDQTIDNITKYPCDVLVLSSFGKIIPKEVLSHPNITPLNIHFSILPLYRGASPIQSSLLNGDIKTGISFMEMVESNVSYCRKITKEDGRINFEETAKEIFNKYRAFSGWPGTYFQYKDTTIKIHGMRIIDLDNNDTPGTIFDVTKDGIHIKVDDSVIVITHIQLPGKKIINSSDIYNSYKDFFVKI